MTDGLVDDIVDVLAGLSVIDCHDHTLLEAERRADVDLAVLFADSDVSDDLIASGLAPDLRQRLTWSAVARHLDDIRNTGFYRSLILAFRELFDFDGDTLDSDDWESLSGQLVAANARADWYEEVLKQRARISTILRVTRSGTDSSAIPTRFFANVVDLDQWVLAGDPVSRVRLAQSVGGTASDLDGFLEAFDGGFEHIRGAAAVKSLIAYRRDLSFETVPASEARGIYRKRQADPSETRRLEDFMMHAAAERAAAYGLPYQIHVGHGSWQTSVTARADPLLLATLIGAHPGTRFVLLHGGYPFLGEMASLAKTYPNVYIECGWLAYIAPAAYRRAMREWLDAVPANKLLAFGADCLHVEQTLGALLLTRRQLAGALADKIREDDWTMELALGTAERLLAGNPARLFHLPVGER